MCLLDFFACVEISIYYYIGLISSRETTRNSPFESNFLYYSVEVFILVLKILHLINIVGRVGLKISLEK